MNSPSYSCHEPHSHIAMPQLSWVPTFDFICWQPKPRRQCPVISWFIIPSLVKICKDKSLFNNTNKITIIINSNNNSINIYIYNCIYILCINAKPTVIDCSYEPSYHTSNIHPRALLVMIISMFGRSIDRRTQAWPLERKVWAVMNS